MISLKPDFIGNMDLRSKEVIMKEMRENRPISDEAGVVKNKMRGKNSAMKRHLRRKAKNVIDERRLKREELLKKEREERERKANGKEASKLPPVLANFK